MSRWPALGALALAALVSACGGGDQVTRFEPQRILSFGDENSVIESGGRKYTVNGLTSDKSALDCTVNPIWVQILATSFNLPFPQCPGTAAATRSKILATPGAKVADFKTQVDQFMTADKFASNDLVTVLVGTNDLWAQYAAYNGSNEAQLTAAMEAAGALLATQVNRLADAGAKVLVSTMPDQSLSPYALAQKAAFTDTDRAALIKRLSVAFHTKLRVTLVNNGQHTGLLLGDEMVQQVVQYPSTYSLVNINAAACLPSAPLPDCSANTLVVDSAGTPADATTWLWADGTHLSPGGHARLGEMARQRANGNPF